MWMGFQSVLHEFNKAASLRARGHQGVGRAGEILFRGKEGMVTDVGTSGDALQVIEPQTGSG